MHNFPRFRLAGFILAIFCARSAAAVLEPIDENAGVGINQTTQLVFPPEMMLRGLSTGEARVVISVDAAGRLTDSLAVGYTEKTFADAALGALKTWSYEPARVHGQARASRADVLFTFKNSGGITIQSYTLTGLDRRMVTLLQEIYSFQACQLRDLDRIPTPLHVVPPAVPKAGAGKGHGRTVTVEFYIDQDGHVRMPSVEREEADDVYAAAAVAAVEQWQFEPPLRKARPVLVLARQEFNFRPKP